MRGGDPGGAPGQVPPRPALNQTYPPGTLNPALLAMLKPLGAQAESLYALFERLGGGQKDFSAILELFRGHAPQA